ncbi:hypothetical protein CLOP_g19638 [Closterium sp. NIES-67]|nr:hypothetical protein CLOP_g19638 [Closterium sp. NIES-67]
MLRGGRKIRKLQECSKVQEGAGRSRKEQEGAGRSRKEQEGAGRSRKEQEKCRKVQESAGGRVSWGG